MVELWVGLNVVNVLATLVAAIVNWRRFRQVRARLRRPVRSEAARVLRRVNYGSALDNLVLNLGIAGLGVAMIVAALVVDGPVQWYVPWGTLGFTVVWVYWAVRQATRWRQVNYAANLAEGVTSGDLPR